MIIMIMIKLNFYTGDYNHVDLMVGITKVGFEIILLYVINNEY
jgi:hypothetical protein